MRARLRSLRPLILSQPSVMVALAVAFVLTMGAAFLAVAATRETKRSSWGIASTHESVLAVQRLLTALTDAEAGQRGYLLTGEESYLQPYREANARIDPLVQELRSRADASESEKRLLANVGTLIAAKRAELAQTIALRRQGAVGAALNIIETDTGERTLQAVRKSLSDLQVKKMEDLREEGARSAWRNRRYQWAGLALMGAAVLLTLTAMVLVARRKRDLAAAFTVCAWTKRVKWRGAWVSFEEFFEQRFHLQFTHGISEEAARQFQAEALAAHRASETHDPLVASRRAPGAGRG